MTNYKPLIKEELADIRGIYISYAERVAPL